MWGGVSHFGYDPVHGGAPLQKSEIIIDRHFSDDDWAPGFFAERILAEFHAENPDWRADQILNGDVDSDLPGRRIIPFHNVPDLQKALFDEITELTQKKPERRFREVEIYDQLGSFLDHFSSQLKITPRHFATHRLMAAADRVGLTVAMHFKAKWSFPRPVQVFPFLVPMIPTPMHPSWPSGHATEAFLVAEALGEAYDKALRPARIIARRIAENREVAGVHFKDDSLAGELIARRVITLLKNGSEFNDLVAAAKIELESVHTV